ncbi:MAG: M20/M25/M40 family metallo-hydrolase [Nitrospirae bacterium]|nr:M20/M25/M40 family metallo-hydrolase [Nitrospirota bacterium]
MTSLNATQPALDHFTTHKAEHLNALKELVRIPSISFPGFDPAPVKQCAGAVAALLTKSGLADVRILEMGAGYPAVFGQWSGATGKPTVLLYAHYDVQPTGREDLWTTPPFEPSERKGRLYGRGTSDDKGGVVMYSAAIASYLASIKSLPVNVKVLIEGEEEVGSTNLNTLLEQHRGLLSADVVVIADSENFDSGIPSLTASLRGIVTVNVEVRSLAASVHSGTWGGPLPDPVLALAKMLASLVDDQGKPAIPGIMDKVRARTPQEQTDLKNLPFSESTYRKQSRLLERVKIIGGEGPLYGKMWHQPSIAVNAIEASSRKQAANIINDSAWARVGIRTVPDMDPEETLGLLTEHLLKQAPWGVQVTIEPETPSRWWKTDTGGPAFSAARMALEKGYGEKPAVVGAGGSIPFVQTITDALGGAPALLFGVGDPYSAAHSEDESMLISDWEKGCRSLILLLSEFAELKC